MICRCNYCNLLQDLHRAVGARRIAVAAAAAAAAAVELNKCSSGTSGAHVWGAGRAKHTCCTAQADPCLAAAATCSTAPTECTLRRCWSRTAATAAVRGCACMCALVCSCPLLACLPGLSLLLCACAWARAWHHSSHCCATDLQCYAPPHKAALRSSPEAE